MAVSAMPTEERRLVRCNGCGTILCAEVAGVSVVTRRSKHGKTYEWVGYVLSMKCDQCGANWRPDSQTTDTVLDSR